MRGLGKGVPCLSSLLPKPIQRRYTLYITNRVINPGYVGAMYFCKAQLLVGRLVWMITWVAMVSIRDRPREGARGAQRTHRRGPEGGYRGKPAFRGEPAFLAAAASTCEVGYTRIYIP